MQPYALKVLTEPASEPITLAQARTRFRLSHTVDDAELSAIWIPAARRYVEGRTASALLTQTMQMTLNGFPITNALEGSAPPPPIPLTPIESALIGAGYSSGTIELARNPVQSVSAIRYYDLANTLQTLDPSLYYVNLGGACANVSPAGTRFWPATYPRLESVQVEFVAGWTSAALIPPLLTAAVLLLVRLYYEEEASDAADRIEQLLSIAWNGR